MSTQTMSRIPRSQPVRMMTPGQLRFLTDLVTQIAQYDRERALVLWAEYQGKQAEGITFAEASSGINALKAERNELRVAKVAEAVPAPKLPMLVPEGRYAVDTDEGHLAFYQVKIDKQGDASMFLQISDELRALSVKTAMGVMAKIEAAGIKEAMTRYGKELRICGAPMCGRTLTNEESRERGIGPVCNDKMGF